MINETYKIELYVDGQYYETLVNGQSTRPSPMQMQQIFRDISSIFPNYDITGLSWNDSEHRKTFISIYIDKR